jgi:uncharacterized protein YyaL (SSP411 family)
MTDAERESGRQRLQRLGKVDRTSLPADGGSDFNRLIFSSSPYLLQHAENPVGWYPWGEEAFIAARQTDKPVLLSIGYATCHWCHVMAHESFEDNEVAAVINRSCIAIKVDREERPDIDEQYMLAAQLLSGGGGWPLTLLMTAEKIPFFAATYLPPRSRGGQLGVIELMERLRELWHSERSQLLANCTSLQAALDDHSTPVSGALPGEELLQDATLQITERYDHRHGGFGSAPKFPMPVYLLFLLRRYQQSKNPELLRMVEESLQRMWAGGIYDQLGFGFHRYSVDAEWLVPHFEKMLYDQALLAFTSLETFQGSGDVRYLQLASEIFTYLQQDLLAPEGGFYAAEDADSAGREGTFYLWEEEEFENILGSVEGAGARRYWGVSKEGNFAGSNILYRPDPESSWPAAEEWRGKLLAARGERERLLRDEKILCGWNGLAIAALARGYAITGNRAWLQAATAAASFIRTRLKSSTGRLLRSYHTGTAAIPAFLEDYAFSIWGLIELHQATLQDDFLDEARHLSVEMLRLFTAPEGGLFSVGSDAEQLPTRMQGAVDGVIPSGLSVAALNLLRLGLMADDAALTTAGERILCSQMGSVTRQPASHLFSLCALHFLQSPPLEITLIGGSAAERETILRSIAQRFLPNLVLRNNSAGGPLQINVCAGGSCRPPLADLASLEIFLDELRLPGEGKG